MLIQHTCELLQALKLAGILEALEEQQARPASEKLGGQSSHDARNGRSRSVEYAGVFHPVQFSIEACIVGEHHAEEMAGVKLGT